MVEEPCFVLFQIIEEMMLLSILVPLCGYGMPQVSPDLIFFTVLQYERPQILLYSYLCDHLKRGLL